ncbi:MAG TPA: hypothetical protein DIC52_00520 [Candidatus Latescibacteria bacterium]|nr:hypothetical protein [Candidatus Latescibacterota bacterium]
MLGEVRLHRSGLPHRIIDVSIDYWRRRRAHSVRRELWVGEPLLHACIHRVGLCRFVFVVGGVQEKDRIWTGTF